MTDREIESDAFDTGEADQPSDFRSVGLEEFDRVADLSLKRIGNLHRLLQDVHTRRGPRFAVRFHLRKFWFAAMKDLYDRQWRTNGESLNVELGAVSAKNRRQSASCKLTDQRSI